MAGAYIIAEKKIYILFRPAFRTGKVNIHKEIAQIVAINAAGQTALYPPVEMIFNPILNQLDYQPVLGNSQQTTWRIEAIALKVVGTKTPGIFYSNFFDKTGTYW